MAQSAELRNCMNELRPYNTIVVSGPQRTGTTIAMEIIARDLGREAIREEVFEVHYFDRLWPLLDRSAVIQAPALSAYCHLLPPSVAVVFMFRDIGEIIDSQDRTASADGKNWTQVEQSGELRKYFRDGDDAAIVPVRIAEVKYDAWERFQKPAMNSRGKKFVELNFRALEGDERYIEKECRIGWTSRQTRP